MVVFSLLGVSLFIIGFVMVRIGGGIRGNASSLKRAAEAIGDTGMPDVSNQWKSIAHWIAILVMALGVILSGKSIFMAVCQ